VNADGTFVTQGRLDGWNSALSQAIINKATQQVQGVVVIKCFNDGSINNIVHERRDETLIDSTNQRHCI